MRPVCVLNRHAGSARKLGDLNETLERHGFDVRFTSESLGAESLARAALEEGAELVVAAGGDGTVSQVVNAFMGVRSHATLGVLPLGTGNDLARTLSLPRDDVEAALAVIAEHTVRAIDVIAADPDDAPRTYAINVAAGGFSGLVDEVLTPERKARLGPLAYPVSAAEVLPDLESYRTTLAWDDGEEETIDALNVVVANARSCGGGVEVAREADLEDGLLDVAIVPWGRLLDLARVGVQLLRGDHCADIVRRRARSVRIRATPPMLFNVDGELVSRAAITFRVVPRALRVIVGSEYRR